MTDCNLDDLNKELAALEIMKELRDDLEGGSLYDKLSELITHQETECNRIAGECGKLDISGVLEEDDSPAGEIIPPDIAALVHTLNE